MTDLYVIAGAVLAIVAGLIGWTQRTRSKAKSEARTEWELQDEQNAADIRRRARDADGVQHDDDQRGFRD